ncbi:MAG: exodeoxyribonuclease III [Pseudomonadota bacterium]|jgi:exodeoxyribonuclease III
MRVISLSCDGIFQAAARGLFEWLANQDAEIICLQDLRARIPELEERAEFQLEGFTAYYLDSSDPHRDGVAIYTRHIPKALIYGFGMNTGEDTDGRYLQADFESVSVVSLLAPQGPDQERQEAKSRFFSALQAHMEKITRKRRRYIYCGGWGTVAAERDVENAAHHQDQPGFLPEDTRWWRQIQEQVGYVDAFRLGNTDSDEFSWWPSGTLGRGDGWRTDTQLVSRELARTVEYAVIYKAKAFSSHAPVIVDYELGDL